MEYILWGHAQLKASYMIRLNIVSNAKIWDFAMEWSVEPTQEQINIEVQKLLAQCQFELDNPVMEEV